MNILQVTMTLLIETLTKISVLINKLSSLTNLDIETILSNTLNNSLLFDVIDQSISNIISANNITDAITQSLAGSINGTAITNAITQSLTSGILPGNILSL